MATGDNTGGIKASSAGLDFASLKGINLLAGAASGEALSYDQVFLGGGLFNVIYTDDFDGAQSATTGAAIIPSGVCFGTKQWRCSIAGAGAAVTSVTTGQDATHFGVVEMQTGTTTTGISTGTQSTASVLFSSGQLFEQHWLVRIPTLSDGTDTFAARWGWVDVPQTPTSGIYFEYVQATSINWRGVGMKASTPTLAAGGGTVAVTAGAWIHLKITWDGTNATFFVDGTNIGTVAAANLPAVACARGFGIVKSAGTITRTVLTDLYMEGLHWTSARAA